ncbi:MAG: methylglyoxal synthase [Hyphomicrobiaceae bacterium]|nr:methylglyoxal synthase [Hyphomicrobiaceae bacterium]
MKKVALVAHDARKPIMVDWVGRNLDIFRQLDLVATGTTGKVLLEHYPELRLERLESGPRGGDQQVGALIVANAIDVLFFFIDPLTPMPHDVDVKALLRLAILYDVPCACSPRAADIVLESVRRAQARRMGQQPASPAAFRRT